MVVAKIFCVLGLCATIVVLKWMFNGGEMPKAGEMGKGVIAYNLLVGIPFTLYLYWLFVSQFLK